MARSELVTGVRLHPGADVHATTTEGVARPPGADHPGGGASVAVGADLFPESAGGRDRCPATGTTSPHDLSHDRGVVPDLMTGNESRHREKRRDGKSSIKNFEKTLLLRVPHLFCFFYEHYFSGSVSFCSCSFNATAFHLTLLRLICVFAGECDWSCCDELISCRLSSTASVLLCVCVRSEGDDVTTLCRQQGVE
ncbi:hypothetical protein PO909_027823 [Leuciscus waleckii]